MAGTINLNDILNETLPNPDVININASVEPSVININATGEDTPIVETTPAPKRVAPPQRKKVSIDDVKKINPNEFIPKKKEEGPKIVDKTQIANDALSMLDAGVKRKQAELHQVQRRLLESSKQHEDMIQEGIEDAPNQELVYMKEETNTLRDKEIEEAEKKANKNNPSHYDPDREIDEFEEDDEPKNNAVTQSAPPSKSVIGNTDDILGGFEPAEEDNPFEEEEYTASEEEPVVEAVEPEKEEAPAVVKEEEPKKVAEEEINPEKVDSQINSTLSYGGKTYSVKTDDVVKPLDINATNIPKQKSEFAVDDEDFDDVQTSTAEKLTDKDIETIARKSEAALKAEILKKVINTGKKLDISNFSVSNKVINISQANVLPKVAEEKTASWPLMFAGRPFVAKTLKGPEIALLAELDDSSRNNGQMLTIQMAQILYEHDANPYKPPTVESWAKTIPFADLDNIFAALYCASLEESNYFPISCPETSCQYSWLADDAKIEDLLKFPNDEVKKRYDAVKATALTAENSSGYEATINAINDKYAVGIKLPSMYTALYEFGQLSSAFAQKYQSIIVLMQYIDYIYKIDPETNSLIPIGWKDYGTDKNKTFRSKIYSYHKLLQSFSDADFSVLSALIQALMNAKNETQMLTFKVPDHTCPKCQAKIPGDEISPRIMVFMRQRLVAIATTPTEK